MGDGQHAWAAAEWVMMVRNCFVREEGGDLIVASGIKPAWWRDAPARLGPVLTPHGALAVQVAATSEGAEVRIVGEWRGAPPRLHVRLPGFKPHTCEPSGTDTQIQLGVLE